MIPELVNLVMLTAVAVAAVAVGYLCGWVAGRYRLLSGADPLLDGRRCSVLTCGNPARADSGRCNWHTSTAVLRRGRLGLAATPTPNIKRKAVGRADLPMARKGQS